MNRKMCVWLMVGLMFGIALSMPLQGASDVIVGMNHWSHDKTNNFLFPTNTSVDVNLSGNVTINEELSVGDDFAVDSTDLFVDTSSNMVGIITNSPKCALDINSDIMCLRSTYTPASASAKGTTGNVCWDSSYIYVCIATDTWKRASIGTW